MDKEKEKVLHGSCKECEQKDECVVGRSLNSTLEEVIVRERDRLVALLEEGQGTQLTAGMLAGLEWVLDRMKEKGR